jgi:hypothetical protein
MVLGIVAESSEMNFFVHIICTSFVAVLILRCECRVNRIKAIGSIHHEIRYEWRLQNVLSCDKCRMVLLNGRECRARHKCQERVVIRRNNRREGSPGFELQSVRLQVRVNHALCQVHIVHFQKCRQVVWQSLSNGPGFNSNISSVLIRGEA